MGYRANVITQQRDYGGQTFCDWEMFTEFTVKALLEYGINDNDAQDFFEIERSELQRFVDTLPENDDKSDAYPDYTNKELKEELQDAINETKDEWVSWEWF